MTNLGIYLAGRSINKSDVSRKTGLSKTRINYLSNYESSHLRAEELVLIALAIGVDPSDLLKELYGHVKLK